MKHRRALLTAALSALVVTVPMAVPAAAATISPPLAEGLAGPLQISVSGRGDVLVAEGFAGIVSTVAKNGGRSILPGVSAEGIDHSVEGGAFFTWGTRSDDPNGAGEALTSVLGRVDRKGNVSTLIDLKAYEDTHNPDQVNTYGFPGLAADCAAQLPPFLGPASYTGLLDTHAYSVASMWQGMSAVADAGGNDIIIVNRNGTVRRTIVLPPQPAVVDATLQAAFGLPDCTLGKSYLFEPVPTDVEVGRGGNLYVTTLPGGPEDPSLGARGKVYKVNPYSGAVTEVASGFAGATNLALSPGGTIFVSELFGGRISKVVNGLPTTYAELDSPAAVEFARGKLYATSGVFGPGQLVTITP